MRHIIGSMLLIDGALHVVYLDDGREYFLNADGQRVYGDWANLDGPDIFRE